jgi:hypothetical protein
VTPSALLAAAAGPVAGLDELTRESAREAARRELSKAIYHRDDPTPAARAVAWLVDTTGRWLEAAVAASPGGLVGIVGLLALGVLAVVALRLRTGPLAPTARRPPALFGGTGDSAADHRRAADRHAADGRWAEAVRARLRAVVRELEDRGVLDPRPGRTADEVAAAAGVALPALATDLRRAARLFDEVWYGGRPASAAADAALRLLDERVRTARAPAASPGAPP